MQQKSKVIVVPCETYEEESVYEALKNGLSVLGGIEAFVKPEEKILVKPNFLVPSLPESAVTTHPSVMKAVFRMLQETGCTNVLYGDSPGHGSCDHAAHKMGLSEDSTYGAKRADMSKEVKVKFEEGKTAREFYFCQEALDTDAILNLCKMKTHALERITGAVKNLYGLICGYRKAAGHVSYPNASVFARMLADIHRYTKPRLHIMDGILAMEGNGPSSGDPTPMNVLLLSEDAVALDTVFCHLVYLDAEMVPTNTQGYALGIGTYKEEEMEIYVVSPEGTPQRMSVEELQKQYGKKTFRVDRTGKKRTLLSRYSDFMTSMAKRPVIEKDKCVKCGICVEHCPVPGKAVNFKNGKEKAPKYDYKKCIRCYCCQEMCPQKAIRTKRRRIK